MIVTVDDCERPENLKMANKFITRLLQNAWAHHIHVNFDIKYNDDTVQTVKFRPEWRLGTNIPTFESPVPIIEFRYNYNTCSCCNNASYLTS